MLPDAEALYLQFADAVAAELSRRGVERPILIGIHSGGVWLAERLHAALQCVDPVGTLDISFYRDDYAHRGLQPHVKPSRIPVDIEGQVVVLIDDILHTGRTIRAALNEVFDYGRPSAVILATLVTRSGHELPIAADICAVELSLPAGQLLKLTGPSPLAFALRELPSSE